MTITNRVPGSSNAGNVAIKQYSSVPPPGTITTPPTPAWNPPVESGATPAAMAAARQQYGIQGPTVAPNTPNTVNNTTATNNPFSVSQFQQMYAQNPALAMRMYGMDSQAGGRNAINAAEGWSPSQANTVINKYAAEGGNGYNPNQGFTGSGSMYSLAPGSNVNMGSLQKFLATGQSNLYGSNPANIPGLTIYGNQFNANPGSAMGQFQSTNQPGMGNLNSQVGSNGPYGASYTGFGNSVEAGPSPAGPTNLPTGPGVNPNSASTSGTNNAHVAGGTGPSTPLVPNGGTPGIAPAPAAPVGPDGGGTPSIGPAPAPNVSPTPTSGNTGGGYAGTNISNSNYNNRFGSTFRPV